MTGLRWSLVVWFFLVSGAAGPGLAAGRHCTGVYVGPDLTADGSVLLGQIADENSSHWIELVPAGEHPPGATVEVGVGPEAGLPGVRTRIPQVRRTARYLTVRYSEYRGVPKPLENGGINQHGVAVIDVWSPSRRELVEMTPRDHKGLSYSDEARMAMQRAKSARQAVRLLGRLIDRHGHASYGGNTHLIADAREGWVMEEFAGGQGLWVARRLGPGEIRVHAPGWFGELPGDWQKRPDYRGSKNLVSFAVERGWYRPQAGRPFVVSEVYEADRDVLGVGVVKNYPGRPGHQIRSDSVRRAENFLKRYAPRIGVEHLMELFRTRPYSNRKSKYAQITRLKKKTPAELRLLWVALGPPETGIYLPFYLGAERIPLEYREHRYLTRGAVQQSYLPREEQARESTRYAFRAFERLFMLVDQRRQRYLPRVLEMLRAREKRLFESQQAAEETARRLIHAGRRDLARRHLTAYTTTEARRALQLAKTLSAALELETRLLRGAPQR